MRRKFKTSPLPYRKGFHRHHVIPIFDGGADDVSNMVYLTKEEHIAAHQERYERLGLEGDRRAVLILRHSKSDLEELRMWRTENARRIAKLAHAAKLANGFYAKLGRLNSERLRGKSQPHLNAAAVKAVSGTKWFNNGEVSKRLKEAPPGWVEGRLEYLTEESKKRLGQSTAGTKWWTDGQKSKRSTTCPGPGWKPGRKT